MRIFVYEHITGGGFVDEPLPASLAAEGELMLHALIDDLTAIPGVEVVVTRDRRLAAVPGPVLGPIRNLFVAPGEAVESILRRGLADADAVWPIAPESAGVLERISRFVAAQGCPLLGSSGDAVRIAASKMATARVLAAAGIPVVHTVGDPRLLPADLDRIVIKPDDGAGCLDTRLHSRHSAQAWWAAHGGNGSHIAQPFIAGDALSLSLLCAGGEAQLLACNRQHVRAIDGVFEFAGVSVNVQPTESSRYAGLATRIARALPGLWGYVGVDLIETATGEGPLVVEVNPRLTTSYAGLGRALGFNPAALVVALHRHEEFKSPTRPPGGIVEIETRHAN